MAKHSSDGRSKGVSLARGPALILGSILLAFGLLAFLTNGDTPTDGFTDGTATGESFLGFDVNGWTAFFTSVAGGLLLFGAAQHLLAKTMSLIVGLALGACSVISLVDGDDVLGLAAANGWTSLGWGLAAAALLINALLPRKGGKDKTADRDHDRDVDVDRRPVAAPRRETAEPRETTTHREVVHRDERVVDRDERVADRDERGVDRDERVTHADDVPRGTSRTESRDTAVTGDRTHDDGSVADDRLRDRR